MKKSYWLILFSLIFAVFVIALFNHNWVLEMEGAAAIISALALVGLLLSLDKQQEAIKQQTLTLEKQDRALEMQREDLALTREEMRMSRFEFTTQNGIFKVQNFETTFFNMINLHYTIVDNLKLIDVVPNDHELDHKETIYEGRSVFDYFEKNLRSTILYASFEASQLDYSQGKFKILIQIIDLMNAYQPDLYHFFNNLSTLIKIVDEQEFSSSNIENYTTKMKYFSILKSQLTEMEIVSFALYALTSMGNSNKLLIEKYSLLSFAQERIEDFSLHSHFETSATTIPLNIPLFLECLDKDDFYTAFQNNVIAIYS